MNDTPFVLAGKTYNSRLITGTGRYKDFAETAAATKASGAEIVTVAVRRVNIDAAQGEMLQDYLDPSEITYLPNTAGCYTAEDAVRTLRLARELGGWNLVKLEVIGDEKTLYPDVVGTLKAAEKLVADGFEVMAYTSDDPLIARELEQIGCCAIMPVGSPIGSGHGVRNPFNVRLIVEQSNVPVLVDAGIGAPSEAAYAMELGCDAVLVNSAIAQAGNPVAMAKAMKLAVEAGRQGYLAGRMAVKDYAEASSPTAGVIGQ